MNVANGLEWTKRFHNDLITIVTRHLVVEAPFEEDTQRATDLMVLKGCAARVACRVRRHRYLERYGNQFTLRSRVRSGAATELDKILDGWGDYMIYAFADSKESRLAAWTLIDLDVFRDLYGAGFPWMPVENRDGTAGQAFSFIEWPDELVVARDMNVDQLAML